MIASSFTQLLTGPLSTCLLWQPSHKCPCAGPEGQADQDCLVCLGEGHYWDQLSTSFKAGLTMLKARDLDAMRARLGPGLTGDAMLSLHAGCPAYQGVQPFDRFIAENDKDALEWVLRPGVPVIFPPRAELREAFTRSTDKRSIVRTALPTLDTDGRLVVNVPMTIRFVAPRRFQVAADFPQIRGWVPGLPKRLMLKLVDLQVR